MKYLNYFQYNSKVILSYFFLSLIVLFLNKLTNKKSTIKFFSSCRGSVFNPLTFITMFTHILGHDNFNHLKSNFIYILLIGPLVEEKYGSINLLIMILVTSFLTALVNILFGKKRILGSSGISFMLIILSSIVNINSGKIPITLILVFVFYVVGEIVDGLFKKDNISHLSHLLGALSGIVFGYYFL